MGWRHVSLDTEITQGTRRFSESDEPPRILHSCSAPWNSCGGGMDTKMTQKLSMYWGKARPAHVDGPQYHLLHHHCLDVAAVGFEYLSLHKELTSYFCNVLRCSQEVWLNWAAFWLSLHDLGKFSEAFQSQRPDLFELLQGRAPNPEKPYTERHDSLGQWLWSDWLGYRAMDENWFGPSTGTHISGLDAWMRAVTGHHGQPPKVGSGSEPSHDFFSKKDKKAVLEFAEAMRELFCIEQAGEFLSGLDAIEFEHRSQSLSWLFAGVAVLADWLGSNTEFFSYEVQETPLETYWEDARQKARKALKEAGVLPAPIKKHLTFFDLFPKIDTPSPLQRWAMEVEITSEPQIHLLEDVTGAGKTEAALTLAYRMMEAGAAQGFFIGLPTMSTANAMYDRVASIYRTLFDSDPNLVLAHGNRTLVESFAASILPPDQAEGDAEQSDDTASARCAAWLADHNKRALLAQAGVGTIDQALLAVLHSKHQSLRLLGLFGKVLIVDEVHACDAYMQGVLEVVLEFHARAGGSAILLSATLPARMKQALLNAYARGRGLTPPQLQKTDYPLVTSWRSSSNEIVEQSIATRPAVQRTVYVEYCSEQSKIIEVIENALSSGRCVCWIRNTVADAMDAYALFADRLPGEKLTLFHARFGLVDRLAKEDLTLELFGSSSTAEQRQGRLVIATQVVEQSLDVDFDLLISDLAPIDRLIQRAGRLRRHIRDAQGNRLNSAGASDQRGNAVMWVFGPEWSDEPTASWFESAFPKASAVYPDHAQLWLTAKALRTGHFSMPFDARDLIEGVFGDEAPVPDGLRHRKNTVLGQQFADASYARANALNHATGYKRGEVVDWWSEAKTPSRLGEATLNLFLARWVDGKILPWAQRKHAWPYSTLRIAERLIAKPAEFADRAQSDAYAEALEQLPDKGKWSVLLPFTCDESGIWRVLAWTGGSEKRPAELRAWQYDSAMGLRMIDQETTEEQE